MLDEFDEILARGRLTAGEMNLQHADLGQLGKNLLPFLGRQFAAGAVEFERVGAIGTLQRAAMRHLGQHGERNAEGFRGRLVLLQHRQPVLNCGSRRRAGVGDAHDVFSRACVKNPLSARSCNIATTSVAIASRGAAYFSASISTIWPTLLWPSQSFSTSTAISSGASTRSGARITQTCRVSSNLSLAWRGKTGRLSSLTLIWRGPAIGSTAAFGQRGARGHEGARRNMALDIGVVQRVELHPEHVGLEDQRVADRGALLRRGGVLPDIFERKASVARRLLQAAAEIAHDVRIDEIIVLQHAGDALLVQVRREQFGQRGGNRFKRGLVAAEMHIGFDREAGRWQNALGRFHIGAVEPESFGEFQPALDAALGADVAIMVLDAVPPFHPDAAVAKTRDHHRVLDRDRALIIIAVQRPGLHLALVELAAMQQAVKRMQAVIAGRADLAQGCFQFAGAVERYALADRQGRHSVGGHHVHSTISVPSEGICQPAASAILRSADPCNKAGLELLICRNSFWPISRPAKASIAPRSPDIAICPMACPVLLPSPAAISSSSRHTVPSNSTSGAPASRDFSSSVMSAQAARK